MAKVRNTHTKERNSLFRSSRWRQLQVALFLLLSSDSVSSDATQEMPLPHTSALPDANLRGQSSSSKEKHFPIFRMYRKNGLDSSDQQEQDEGSGGGSKEKTNNNNNGGTRKLKSSSDSRDTSNEDDYWRWPDDYFIDDYYYKFVGDPLPPSLFPLTRRDVIGFMFASLGVTLGSSGSVGGGGIVVPVYIVAMGLAPRIAIPLGSVTVLGGSFAGLLLNLRRRHPLADRPIIDWDLILVMEPLVMVGALVGAILHRVVSEKILTVLLVLLLSVVAHTTLAKAKRMFEAEDRYIEHLKAARWEYLSRVASFRSAFRASGWSAEAIPGGGEETKTYSPSPPVPLRTQSLDSRSTLHRMDSDEKQRILILNPDFVTLRTDLLEQEKVTPRSKVIALLLKFFVINFLNITLGGGAFDSPWGIECGSVAFWVVHVIMIAFLIATGWAAQVRSMMHAKTF